MKYYIYISDSKVEMLLAQIQQRSKIKRSTEIGFDLKVISAKRKSEVDAEQERIAKLDIVVDFIRAYGNVGTVADNCEYVADTMPAVWGPCSSSSSPSELSPFVYFGGLSSQTIVGLGGSARHVLGYANANQAPVSLWGYSSAPALYSQLVAEVERDGESVTDDEKNAMNLKPGRPTMAVGWGVLDIVATALTKMAGPIVNIDFLARRLMSGKHVQPPENLDIRRNAIARQFPPSELAKMNSLLASPLYVALADDAAVVG